LRARGFKVVHMVAKTPVRTLAEYDAQAEKALAGKQLAAEANPLASRSLVWPVASGFTAPPAQSAAAPAAAAPAPEKPQRPTRRSEDEEPWDSRVFRN
jgi:hypothetical protein